MFNEQNRTYWILRLRCGSYTPIIVVFFTVISCPFCCWSYSRYNIQGYEYSPHMDGWMDSVYFIISQTGHLSIQCYHNQANPIPKWLLVSVQSNCEFLCLWIHRLDGWSYTTIYPPSIYYWRVLCFREWLCSVDSDKVGCEQYRSQKSSSRVCQLAVARASVWQQGWEKQRHNRPRSVTMGINYSWWRKWV